MSLFNQRKAEHLDCISKLSDPEDFVFWLKMCKKILVCGNGGSAADAQHFVGELVGRFQRERRPINALALSTNSTILTAIGNDYGFKHIFERQIEAIGDPGDALLVISTSGNSENITLAVEKAKSIGMTTFALLGNFGGLLKGFSDFEIIVRDRRTAVIQEAHGFILHYIAEALEASI